MHQGKQVGLGEDLTEHLQTTLTTTHAGKPIVDQGDFHVLPPSPTLWSGQEFLVNRSGAHHHRVEREIMFHTLAALPPIFRT